MAKNIILFVTDNEEKQVLQIMLESYGYTVLPLIMQESSYREVVQYDPSHVVFELPVQCEPQLALINRIRTSNQTYRIPILAYGDPSKAKSADEIQKMGVSAYIERPLSTEIIQRHIKSKRKGSKTLHSKEMQIYEGELEDTAKIMSDGTSPAERIEIMVKRIGELLAFPFTVAKVLSVTQSETTGANDLAKAIELDPVVVTSVLKVANSAFYKGSSSTMGVKDAIVRIGFSETKNIAIAMSVMKLFSDEEKSVGFSREDFWFHSLATAIIAGELARIVRYPKPEVAFIGGLMHDFGIILLDEFFPTFLNSTLQETIKSGESFTAVQQRRWKMTHHAIVARLFREWNMPEEMIELIKNCFRYESYENSNDAEIVKLVHSVGIAEVMAKSLALGRECDEFVSIIPNRILDTYKVMNQLGDRFWKKVAEELNMFSSFLNLKKEKVEFSRDLPEEKVLHSVHFIDFSKQLLNPFEYYLISQNNRITKVKSIEDIDELERSPEIIVVMVGEEDNLETIEPWMEIKVKKTFETEDSSLAEKVPVIIFSDHSLGKSSSGLPDHVVILPTSIDLRVFSFALESLCLGHPFSMDYKHESPKEVFHEVQEAEQVPFSYKTRIVGKAVAVLEVHGTVASDQVKEISKILSALFKKTKYIGIDFSQAARIGPEVILILHNFRKALRQKGGVVTLFTLDESIRNSLDEDKQSMLFSLKDEVELIQIIKSEIAALQNS